MTELLGFTTFIDWTDFLKLTMRFSVNLLIATVVIRGIYYPIYKNIDYVFSYYLFNVVTFFLCFLLRKVPTELGFALALFGVFGILKYRTEQIRVRELTYLFAVIGLALLNAIVNKSISAAELITVNLVIVGTIALLEFTGSGRKTGSREMIYDRLDLLHPGKEKELYEDIGKRTGLNVRFVDIVRFDLLKDSAQVVIQYTLK